MMKKRIESIEDLLLEEGHIPIEYDKIEPMIKIDAEVYDELCKCVGEENLEFMGIS